MEVIKKDIQQPRLTITPSRSTLKIPLKYEESYITTITEICNNIVEETQPKLTKAFRGVIKFDGTSFYVRLVDDRNNDVMVFTKK